MEAAPACLPCADDEPSRPKKETPPAFFFSKGPNTYRVTSPLPVAARAKLVAALAAKGHSTGAVLLRGGMDATRNDTDHEVLFRQESYFAHLFGVAEPNCWGIIELPTGRATLLIPRLAPEYAVWMGKLLTPEQFRTRYHVDACSFTDELTPTLESAINTSAGPVHIMSGVNSDSDLNIAEVLPVHDSIPPGMIVDSTALYAIAAECRVLKSADEIDIMRYVAWVSSAAHASVMADTRPGMMEYQLEALFLFHCACTSRRAPSSSSHRLSLRACSCASGCSCWLLVCRLLSLSLARARRPRRLPACRLHVHLRVRPKRRRAALRPRRRAE